MTVPKLYTGATQISPFGLQPEVFYSPRRSSSDASMPLVVVTPGAAVDTKGAWVELVASTSATVDWLTLYVTGGGASGQPNNMLWDIGVGAAGSETVLVANIAVGYSNSAATLTAVDVPVAIAAGTRIAVRYQSPRTAVTSSANVQLARYPTSSGVRSPSSVDSIGAATSTATGVALGATANTFVEIAASTARAYRGVVLTVTSADIAMTGTFPAFDLGVGAAGAEVPHLGARVYTSSTTEALFTSALGGSSFIPVDIPAGSRLSVRAIDNTTNNSGFSAVLLGVPA